MIDFFFGQTRGVQALLLLVHGVVVLLVAYLVMLWLGRSEQRKPGLLPVGPFFVSVSLLYGMFLAFHASTIWAHQHEAELQFRDTVTVVSQLQRLVGPRGVNAPAAQHSLEAYITAVIEDEWPTGNTKPSPRAIAALDDLRAALIQAAEATPTAVGVHIFHLLDKLVEARAARLWVGMHNRNLDSWAVVLMLGLLSHIAVGFVHLDRPRAGLLAITLFALATSASYWLLTGALNPFVNVDYVNSAQVWGQVHAQ